MKIALISIGNELLNGKTVNTNAAEIGAMLAQNGFSPEYIAVIPDERTMIFEEIARLSRSFQCIIITGGLGPTTDDNTRKVLLEYFGGEMICDDSTLERIKENLSKRGRPLTPSNEAQAMVPSSCEVLQNMLGTAPGMLFRKENCSLFALPGVPFEMRGLMKNEVVPRILGMFPGRIIFNHTIRTFGIAEAVIADKLADESMPDDQDSEVSFLPDFDGVRIGLTLISNRSEEKTAEKKISDLRSQIFRKLEKYVYSFSDKKPSEEIAELLRATGQKIICAESCTGGNISRWLVQNSGISEVFRGSFVTYMDEIKVSVLGISEELINDFGVVSKEVAEAMASAALEKGKADFAISTTGYAEAAAGEATRVWVAFASKDKVVSREFPLFKTRIENIEYATQAALVFALKNIRECINAPIGLE